MKQLIVAAAALASVVVPLSGALAVSYTNRAVGWMQASAPYSDCFMFSLDGVAVADPSIAGHQWFGLRRTHPHFAELYAMILTAKATGRTIDVHTAGAGCGGFALAETIFMR